MDKSPEGEEVRPDAVIFTAHEQRAMDALVEEGDASDAKDDTEYGDELYGDVRDVATTALMRGGAAWGTTESTIEFDDEDGIPPVVSTHPSLSPTDAQVEVIRRQMEAELSSVADEGDGGDEGLPKESSVTRSTVGPSASMGKSVEVGYVPTWAERIKGLFK